MRRGRESSVSWFCAAGSFRLLFHAEVRQLLRTRRAWLDVLGAPLVFLVLIVANLTFFSTVEGSASTVVVEPDAPIDTSELRASGFDVRQERDARQAVLRARDGTVGVAAADGAVPTVFHFDMSSEARARLVTAIVAGAEVPPVQVEVVQRHNLDPLGAVTLLSSLALLIAAAAAAGASEVVVEDQPTLGALAPGPPATAFAARAGAGGAVGTLSLLLIGSIAIIGVLLSGALKGGSPAFRLGGWFVASLAAVTQFVAITVPLAARYGASVALGGFGLVAVTLSVTQGWSDVSVLSSLIPLVGPGLAAKAAVLGVDAWTLGVGLAVLESAVLVGIMLRFANRWSSP